MVSKTFYLLVLVSLINIVIAMALLGVEDGTVFIYRITPSWIPALLLLVIAILDIIIGYLFENYTFSKKKVR